MYGVEHEGCFELFFSFSLDAVSIYRLLKAVQWQVCSAETEKSVPFAFSPYPILYKHVPQFL